MNRVQLNETNMFEQVDDLFAANQGVVDQIPALQAIQGTLGDNIIAILQKKAIQDQVISGITLDKDRHRDTATELGLKLAGALFTYAEDQQNQTLALKVNFSEAAFDRLSEANFITKVEQVHSLAITHQQALEAGYGVTPQQITDFQTAIGEFKSWKPRYQDALNLRKAATAGIKTLVRDTKKLLRIKGDKIMLQAKDLDPAFYEQYVIKRKVVKLGIRYASNYDLIGHIAGPDGGSVSGINVMLRHPDGHITTTRATANGNYRFKVVPRGQYTVIVEADNFERYEQSGIDVNKHPQTVLNITLQYVPGLLEVPEALRNDQPLPPASEAESQDDQADAQAA